MAAAADREVPSALCSEFLNFSAKDTAAVSDSVKYKDNMVWSMLSGKQFTSAPALLRSLSKRGGRD